MIELTEETKEELLKDFMKEVVEGFQEAIEMFNHFDEIETTFEAEGETYTLTVKKQK